MQLLDVPRQALRNDLRRDDLGWERGKARAFEQSMGAASYCVESNPAMSLMGQLTLRRIVADTLQTPRQLESRRRGRENACQAVEGPARVRRPH